MSEEKQDPPKILLPKQGEIRALEEPEKSFSIQEIFENITPHTPKIKLVSNLGSKKISTLFNISALTKKKKYGSKESIKLGENDEELIDATLSLTENIIFYPKIEFRGEGKLTKAQKQKGIEKKIIIKSVHGGIRKSVPVDGEGNYVKKKNIEYYKREDEESKLPVYPSNLYSDKNPRKITINEVAEIERILDTNIQSRYILFPVEGEDDSEFKNLINNMETVGPHFLTFKFNYRKGTNQKDAFLVLIEEDGNEYILMCVGLQMDIKWVGLEELPEENLFFFEKLDLDLKI